MPPNSSNSSSSRFPARHPPRRDPRPVPTATMTNPRTHIRKAPGSRPSLISGRPSCRRSPAERSFGPGSVGKLDLAQLSRTTAMRARWSKLRGRLSGLRLVRYP